MFSFCFTADVQQNLGKYLTTQIKEEIKEEEIEDTKESNRNTPPPPTVLMRIEKNSEEQEQQQQQLLSSRLNNNNVKNRSANSSPARSTRSWHDSDDENFIDDDRSSSLSSAISLTVKTSRQNSESTLYQTVFRQHLDRHYPRDSPVCPVIECGRRFAHPNSVRNHMRIKHTLQWAKMKAMRSSGGPFAGGPDFK
uniref:C2H2-type domain-containing protein n=1 Tax=Glossina pallidipes TaxID=7398 RepID=A0A1B0A0T1_GLOPL